MTDFLKMDIFFGVATVATIAVAALVCIALFYLIRVLRAASRVADEVEEEAKALRADIAETRESLKREGFKLRTLSNAFHRSMKRLLGGKRS